MAGPAAESRVVCNADCLLRLVDPEKRDPEKSDVVAGIVHLDAPASSKVCYMWIVDHPRLLATIQVTAAIGCTTTMCLKPTRSLLPCGIVAHAHSLSST